MPPKDVKLQKTKAKKGPEFRTDDADLQPFSVKAGQLVRNALGCTGVVLGVKPAAPGGPMCLWVRYEGGLQAPIDIASMQPCEAVEQLQSDIQQRREEQRVLDAQWATHNASQAQKEDAAAKAAAMRRKKRDAAAARH